MEIIEEHYNRIKSRLNGKYTNKDMSIFLDILKYNIKSQYESLTGKDELDIFYP